MSYPLEPTAIAEELARVLGSADFVASKQLTQFLQYVVDKSLEGRGEILKERMIALHALDRDSDFDPRVDSIVRVVAGKLRRSLERYYWCEGAANPMRIELPKGSYQPLFSPAVGVSQSPLPRQVDAVGQVDAAGQVNVVGAVAPAEPAGVPNRSAPDTMARATKMRYIAIPLAIACCVAIGFVAVRYAPSDAAAPGPSTPVAKTPVTKTKVRIGALPYRVRDSDVEVLIVRTARDSHWTIPKSTFAADDDLARVAASGAFDEAGVAGVAQSEFIGEYRYRRGDTWSRVFILPVQVENELSSWPESSRERRWCDVETAAELIASDRLSSLIRDFRPH